jgi:hypothetical protein
VGIEVATSLNVIVFLHIALGTAAEKLAAARSDRMVVSNCMIVVMIVKLMNLVKLKR